VATMHFMPSLREYLLRNNFVYTVRKYRYTPSQGMVFIPGVGGCHRELVKENVTKGDLVSYSGSSGFATVDDWWDMIVKINPRLPDLHLYYVSVVRRL